MSLALSPLKVADVALRHLAGFRASGVQSADLQDPFKGIVVYIHIYIYTHIYRVYVGNIQRIYWHYMGLCRGLMYRSLIRGLGFRV